MNTLDGLKSDKLTLTRWANALTTTRAFFAQRQVLEVTTPILQTHPISDVYIDSIGLTVNPGLGCPKKQYLHTSPELAMKPLLVNGSGDIYQICQTFRDNESGQYNQNEFTLLEWYRLDTDMHQLIDEVLAYLGLFLPKSAVFSLSYQAIFKQVCGFDILAQDLHHLKDIAKSYGLNDDFDCEADGQLLLFVHCIEPVLKQYSISVVYDYPASQSALAQIKTQAHGNIAKRFEVYIRGIEIANGYQELQSELDYRTCFEQDKAQRKVFGRPDVEINQPFLKAISPGLPACSGVALGFSRLFYLLNALHKL